MVCECGNILDENAAFCSQCGKKTEKQEQALFCKNCGSAVKSDAVFCDSCGNRVDFKKEQAINEPIKLTVCTICGNKVKSSAVFCEHCGNSINGYKKQKKSKIVIYVLIVTVIIAMAVVAIGFAVNYFGHDDSSISTEMREAYPLMTEDTYVDSKQKNETLNVEGIYYKIYGSTLVISGNGDVDKKTVDSFSKKSFDSILFEYGTINIPDDTFSGYSNVTEVELKNVVAKIGARAFKGCGMQKMVIGRSVEQIGEDAFADCAISDVFVNNEEIRKNLNNRTDFGRLFENASKIQIYYDYTMVIDIYKNAENWDEYWGDYLECTDKCARLKSIATQRGETMGTIDYNLSTERNWGDFYLFEYKTGIRAETDIYPKKYDAETNTISYIE